MRYFAFLILFCNLMITTAQIPLSALEGKWYIQKSNFPMWLKGDKIKPNFNYTVEQKHGDTVLLDVVTYIKKAEEKTIKGYDHIENKSNTSFTWRGKGLLFIAKSRWTIEYISPEEDWMLIKFEKTLFTPAGHDVITREQFPDKGKMEEIDSTLRDIIPSVALSTILQ